MIFNRNFYALSIHNMTLRVTVTQYVKYAHDSMCKSQINNFSQIFSLSASNILEY